MRIDDSDNQDSLAIYDIFNRKKGDEIFIVCEICLIRNQSKLGILMIVIFAFIEVVDLGRDNLNVNEKNDRRMDIFIRLNKESFIASAEERS